MVRQKTMEKLAILASAAKYDASCASSGSKRANTKTGLGNSTGLGICHSYTPDGRCVSLLKILFTNHCIYDCAFCVSRRSADVQRAAFTVDEVVELTLAFYARNYIEGLFLSSGIFKHADATTERLVRVARSLRERDFNGYIHLKVIPGADDELIRQAGLYADRLSVNLEIASEPELQRVAPEKDHASALGPMDVLKRYIEESRTERRHSDHAPLIAPGGQSTQLVVGATAEDDRTILHLADRLYRRERLRRVYYSGYIPIDTDARVPLHTPPPLLREHRLYQADWLLRVYGFDLQDLLAPAQTHLDLDLDPKSSYALRMPHLFPVDVNTAPRERLLRVPGMGVRSVERILALRRVATVRWDDLHQMGVVLRRAQHFITVPGHRPRLLDRAPERVRMSLVKRHEVTRLEPQLSLFAA